MFRHFKTGKRLQHIRKSNISHKAKKSSVTDKTKKFNIQINANLCDKLLFNFFYLYF